MIARYSRPKMASLWSDEAQYRTWLDIEILACEGWCRVGKISAKDLQTIKEKAHFEIEEILEVESQTKHDVAAFVSVVQKHIGEAGRYFHYGLTSSDILDTTLSYRLKKSAELLISEIDQCLLVTKERALKDKTIPMIGRTHGIHAEPITMGTKWLLWHDLIQRAKARLLVAKDEISFGKISGAVGNYAHVPPEIEMHVCAKLGLRVDTLSTQVISRDRYAIYFSMLAMLASVIEAIVTEIRHLQRTEVGEAREGFTKGQKGSSAMPHKMNPILSENLTGLSRIVRSMVIPAMENCSLWHERDISHSSVERIIAADGNLIADFMLSRLHHIFSHLEIFPKRMEENLNQLQGVIYSQRVLNALIEKGMARDEAYEIVQNNALLAIAKRQSFLKLLQGESKIAKKLSEPELSMLFEPQQYSQRLDYLYQKVLKDGS